MKFAALVLAVSLAVPMTAAIPAPAEAQVLSGRGGDTRRVRPAPRPALTEREEDRLYAAEEAVEELTQQIEELEAATEPTAAQIASLAELREQLEDEQKTVDRLQRKRDRRG